MGIQIADFFRHADDGVDLFVVTLLVAFDGRASGSANFDRNFFAARVAHVLRPVLLVHVLGGAGGLVNGSAGLGAVAVADLVDGGVTFLDDFFHRFRGERDLAQFLKVFFAQLFLQNVQ